MIKNGLVPNLDHSVAINYGFQCVRPECAERHREKAKCRGNANKCNHFLCYLQWPFILANVLIAFSHFVPGWESGRRLPHSKSWYGSKRRQNLRSVLECARPSALFLSFPNSRGRGIQNRLRLIDRAFAFRIKCVVNNKLALKNLVVRQSECPKAARDPTQTFASGVRIGWPRISRADNFTEK